MQLAGVQGVAASAASLIAMAGDEVRMPENSFLFIHNPWMMAAGDAKTMRKIADDLDLMRDGAVRTYQRKVGDRVTTKELVQMLDAETWLGADKAVELGFADVLEQPIAAAALSRFDHRRWPNLPSALSVHTVARHAAADELQARRNVLESLK